MTWIICMLRLKTSSSLKHQQHTTGIDSHQDLQKKLKLHTLMFYFLLYLFVWSIIRITCVWFNEQSVWFCFSISAHQQCWHFQKHWTLKPSNNSKQLLPLILLLVRMERKHKKGVRGEHGLVVEIKKDISINMCGPSKVATPPAGHRSVEQPPLYPPSIANLFSAVSVKGRCSR